ncbi:MAG TPA: GapR family DNA-binding domain-containing protein [Pseudolabrys sp.]|nr:GapR family DNA-binding domain-containing protein [Pseudolabrys sp.]
MTQAGTNGFDPDKVKSFIERIENLQSDIRTVKAENAVRCKTIMDDIKIVLDEAKEDGIPRKELKAVLKARELERRLEETRDNLDGESQETFDQIRFALGDLAETPLGGAALARAERGKEAVDSLAS